MNMLSAVAAVILLVCLQPVAAQPGTGADLVPVELSTVGVDGRTGSPLVLLREPESGDVVPIWVGTAEAQAIARALHGIAMPRPMTHDLMASLLVELHATVDEVIVHDLRDNTYFGAIRLRVAGEDAVRTVDSRPSDALALAQRTGARIRVARKILVSSPDFDFVAPEGPDQIVQLLGITVVAPSAELRREHALPDRPGVVVTNAAGRPHEQGLRRGDLIVAVNDRAIRQPMDFFEAVRAVPPGRAVRITYLRQEEERTFELPTDLPPVRTTPGGGRLTV